MPSSSCTRTHAPRSSRTISFSPFVAVATTGAFAVGCVRSRRRSESTDSVSDVGGGASVCFPLRRISSASSAKKITPRMMTTVRPRVCRVCASGILHQHVHDRLLHVQPVLGFVVDDRLRRVDDLAGHFL